MHDLTTNNIVPSSILLLVSGISSLLLSLNRTLISPIMTHEFSGLFSLPIILSISVCTFWGFSLFLHVFLVLCGRLSGLNDSFWAHVKISYCHIRNYCRGVAGCGVVTRMRELLKGVDYYFCQVHYLIWFFVALILFDLFSITEFGSMTSIVPLK